jgi:thiopurine S-methyltransferase
MTNAWINRWENDQIGWHQTKGHSSIDKFWHPSSGSVLVPLCGKTFDLLKLAELGYQVTGVEISDKAARSFFHDNGYSFQKTAGDFPEYTGRDIEVRIVVADFFDFTEDGFSALYDRAALIALPEERRSAYADHVHQRLSDDAFQLLVSIDYDQSLIDGPPYAVSNDEVRRLYPELTCVATSNDIQNSPPKFAAAGVSELYESIWVSHPD